MRLIDADALFEELNNKQMPWNRRINDIIMAQPTAYDVEKVVKQLRKKQDDALTYTYQVTIEEAIAVVRKGGK